MARPPALRRLARWLLAAGLVLTATAAAASQAAGPEGAVSWAWLLGAMGGALVMAATVIGYLARQAWARVGTDLIDLERRVADLEHVSAESRAHFRYIREALQRLEGRAA